MSPAHFAVEIEDAEKLQELLDEGASVHEEHDGLTLLHHAIEAEVDGHAQTGDRLHVDPLRPWARLGEQSRLGLGETAR